MTTTSPQRLRKLAAVVDEADKADGASILTQAADEFEQLEAKLDAANRYATRNADALNAYLFDVFGTPEGTRKRILEQRDGGK